MAEGFDLREWLDEQNLRVGKEWEKCADPDFSGIVQEYCDVKLTDGTQVGPCWPYAGRLIDLSSDDEESFPESRVAEVRYYESVLDGDEETEEKEDSHGISGTQISSRLQNFLQENDNE